MNLLSRQRKRRIVLDYSKVINKLHTGQNELLKEVLSGRKKYAALMAHRRYGKDFISFLVILLCAIKYQGNYYIFAPYFRQAKEIVVDGKTIEGMPLLPSLIPRDILKNPKAPNIVNRSDWSVELFNSSKIFIRGADNPNSNVGVGARGIIYTEAALMKPGFYQYMKPAIDTIINKTGFGIVIFISTPRGKHNWFTKLFIDYFKKLPKNPRLKKDWYVSVEKASSSTTWNGKKVLSEKQLTEARLEMTPEMYEQEYECSCNTISAGAWYAQELEQAFKDKRIGRFGNYEEIPGKGVRYTNYYWANGPLYICWDIGRRDHTALWFYQINPYNGKIRFIHHYRVKGAVADHLIEYIKNFCKEKGFTNQPLNILPHDGDNHEWLTSSKRSDYLKDKGLDVFTLSQKVLSEHNQNLFITQINSIRVNFKNIEIDNEECSEGVIKLSEYVKKRNKQTGEYIDVPDHDANDKASDDADSFRMGMIYYIEFLKDSQKYVSEAINADTGKAITYDEEDYFFDDGDIDM